MINKETYIEGVSCPNPKYVEHLEDKISCLKREILSLKKSIEDERKYSKELKEKSSPKRAWYT